MTNPSQTEPRAPGDRQSPPQKDEAVARASRRAPALVMNEYQLSSDTRLRAPWRYNKRQYEVWEIYAHWPAGFLLHMAGPSDAGVPIQAIWRDEEHYQRYMGDVGIHRFTEVIRVLGEEDFSDAMSLADVEPIHRCVTYLAFGPLARHFIDIGPDLDESSARQLGDPIAAIEIAHLPLSRAQIDELWHDLRLVGTLAPEMVLRFQEEECVEDGAPGPDSGVEVPVRETQVWSSRKTAAAFVRDELMPALRRLGVPDAELPAIEPRELKRLAIGGAELDPARLDALS